MDYITNNYITLLLLSALSMLLIVNRKMKTSGLNFVWAIIGIVFGLTLCEALEDACDVYHWNYRILYFKTALVYWLYPLTAMLELYLIVPIQHTLLMAIPYLINFVLVFIDLFDTRIIYYFDQNHHYQGGILARLPVAVVCFYVMMLGFHSVLILKSGYRSKGVIALFMTVTAVLSAFGERIGFAMGKNETVTAIEMLVYYFFLTSIDHRETLEKLYQKRIELEQQKLRLLLVQIQPHFIFNILTTIQSLCYTDSEAAADCIDVFGDYLRANISSFSSDEPIPFLSELKHIEQYIQLEKISREADFIVIYELKVKNFRIPPLTVQPIVENAIKHGVLSRRDGKGKVKIKTEEKDGLIIITVTDNGTGASLTPKQKEHHSVGVENVRKRLEVQCNGTLEINFTGKGCEAVMKLPKIGNSGGELSDVYYWS